LKVKEKMEDERIINIFGRAYSQNSNELKPTNFSVLNAILIGQDSKFTLNNKSNSRNSSNNDINTFDEKVNTDIK
jgi:hypothetical protein